MKNCGIIYMLTDKMYNKSYIGQTKQKLDRRIEKHYIDGKCGFNFFDQIYYLFGKDNFTLTLLEENIPINKLNDREKFYINKYDTFFNGYNKTLGGSSPHNAKLTDNIIDSIKKDLYDKKISYRDIQKKYKITRHVLYDINNGRSYLRDNDPYEYPIRIILNKKERKPFTEEEVAKIECEILNNDISLYSIAKKYDSNTQTINYINNGTYFNSSGKYEYPLRKTFKHPTISKDDVERIYQLLSQTNLSREEICSKINNPEINVHIISSINCGKYKKYCDLLENITYPIRKHRS